VGRAIIGHWPTHWDSDLVGSKLQLYDVCQHAFLWAKVQLDALEALIAPDLYPVRRITPLTGQGDNNA